MGSTKKFICCLLIFVLVLLFFCQIGSCEEGIINSSICRDDNCVPEVDAPQNVPQQIDNLTMVCLFAAFIIAPIGAYLITYDPHN